jgi:hypothetical protein
MFEGFFSCEGIGGKRRRGVGVGEVHRSFALLRMTIRLCSAVDGVSVAQKERDKDGAPEHPEPG